MMTVIPRKLKDTLWFETLKVGGWCSAVSSFLMNKQIIESFWSLNGRGEKRSPCVSLPFFLWVFPALKSSCQVYLLHSGPLPSAPLLHFVSRWQCCSDNVRGTLPACSGHSTCQATVDSNLSPPCQLCPQLPHTHTAAAQETQSSTANHFSSSHLKCTTCRLSRTCFFNYYTKYIMTDFDCTDNRRMCPGVCKQTG